MTAPIPKNTLIVVCDGAHAKLYRNVSDTGLKIESAGELKHRKDEHGAARTPAETSPKEQGEAGFAHSIASDLYDRIHKGGVDNIVLIADPQTLGQIRPTLHKEVSSRIIRELSKTLTNSSIADIEKSLEAA